MFDKFYENNIFFFFQAEDGIRHIGVTGVQTCALPISCPAADRGRTLSGPSQRYLSPAWAWRTSRSIGDLVSRYTRRISAAASRSRSTYGSPPTSTATRLMVPPIRGITRVVVSTLTTPRNGSAMVGSPLLADLSP